MDSLPKAKRKNEKATDAEKLAVAIKKAKYERARKAVNDSFDHSIGSLRKRRQRKQAALNQSFALKQAATLQKKNKEIVTELAKSRQYSTKLERVNFYFKQQQMAMAMRIASLEGKMKNLYEENKNLKQSKDDFVATLTSQLTATLDSVDAFKMGQNKLSSVENITSRRQPMRVIRQASSKHDSELSTNPEVDITSAEPRGNSKPSFGNVQVENNLARSPSPPNILTPVAEERDHEDEDEDNSFVEIAEDPLNDASAKLDISENADSSDTESEKATEKVSLDFDNLDYDEAENVTNHDTVSMDLTEVDANESTGGQRNEQSGNMTEKSPNSCANEIAESQASGVTMETVEKSLQMSGNTPENESSEPTSTEVTMAITQHSKAKKTEVKQKKKKKTPCFDILNNSVFDFLSNSSDSFVRDNEKSIRLNCAKSLSPEKLPTKSRVKQRFSQPVAITDDENTPPRRTGRRRAAGAVSYAELPLNSKLRRGDRMFRTHNVV